jgi:hypothetical protein
MRASMRNFRIRQEYERQRRRRPEAKAEPLAELEPERLEPAAPLTPSPPTTPIDRFKQYFRTIWSQICQQFRDLRQ